MAGLEGEAATGPVVQGDAGVAGHHPRAEGGGEAVDERHHVAVAVGDREVARVRLVLGDPGPRGLPSPGGVDEGAPVGGVGLAAEPLERPADEGGISRVAVPVGEGQLLGFHEEVDPVRAQR